MRTSGFGETRRRIHARRDARLEDVSETAMTGFGLRVLRGGAWGFYGSANLSRAAVLAGVEIALANARAVSPIQLRPIVVETLPCIEAQWTMPLGVDPFDVDAGVKAEFLLAVNARLATRVLISRSRPSWRRARTGSLRTATAVAFCKAAPACIRNSRSPPWTKLLAAFATRDSLAPARGAGWTMWRDAALSMKRAQAHPTPGKSCAQSRRPLDCAMSSLIRAICS